MAHTLVRMKHPDLDHKDRELPVTTQTAFEQLWQDKGWELAGLVDESEIDDIDAITADEMRRRLEAAGISYPARAKKDELKALLVGQEG